MFQSLKVKAEMKSKRFASPRDMLLQTSLPRQYIHQQSYPAKETSPPSLSSAKLGLISCPLETRKEEDRNRELSSIPNHPFFASNWWKDFTAKWKLNYATASVGGEPINGLTITSNCKSDCIGETFSHLETDAKRNVVIDENNGANMRKNEIIQQENLYRNIQDSEGSQ